MFFYLNLKYISLLTSQARILNACLTNLVKLIVLEYKICVELNFICIYVLKFNFLYKVVSSSKASMHKSIYFFLF